MATTRAFGQPIINGKRKALGQLNTNNIVKNSSICSNNIDLKQSTAFQKTKSFTIEDQENCPKSLPISTFKIYSDDCNFPSPGKNQEEILRENIEAVKKELNSFLIDSFEKSFSDNVECNDVLSSDKHEKTDGDVSFMTVDLDDNDEDQKENQSNEKEISQLSSQHSEISYVQNYSQIDLLSDYSRSIWMYMLERERQFMANPFYMIKQQYINPKMRSILVDWMVEVTDEYNLKDETFFLAINYIDRFLSHFSISRQEFQLLGTSALFIASKYEEIYPPDVSDFVFVTDDSFSKEQVLSMEKTILNGLQFDVSVPTSSYFLEYFSAQLTLDKQTFYLAKYLTYLTSLECSPFLKYYPSEIALCSILLAYKLIGNCQPIREDFIDNSLIYEKNLGDQGDVIKFIEERKNLMGALNQLRIYANKHPQQAIRKRYSEPEYYNVSKIADETEL